MRGKENTHRPRNRRHLFEGALDAHRCASEGTKIRSPKRERKRYALCFTRRSRNTKKKKRINKIREVERENISNGVPDLLYYGWYGCGFPCCVCFPHSRTLIPDGMDADPPESVAIFFGRRGTVSFLG